MSSKYRHPKKRVRNSNYIVHVSRESPLLATTRIGGLAQCKPSVKGIHRIERIGRATQVKSIAVRSLDLVICLDWPLTLRYNFVDWYPKQLRFQCYEHLTQSRHYIFNVVKLR